MLSQAFAYKDAALMGIGNEIFFFYINLYIIEVLELLGGDKSDLAWIAIRQQGYEKYKALPPFPPVIRGRVDPFIWSKNENRRMNFYSGAGSIIEEEHTRLLSGFTGSSGMRRELCV